MLTVLSSYLGRIQKSLISLINHLAVFFFSPQITYTMLLFSAFIIAQYLFFTNSSFKSIFSPISN